MLRTFSLFALAALLTAGLAACDGYPQPAVCEADSEIAVTDLEVGVGAAAAFPDTVRVSYTGRLEDGDVFEDEDNLTTIVNRLSVLGLREGVVGMQRNGRRRIVVPPALGYGGLGLPGVVPPCETLTFEVELHDLRPSGG